VRMSDDDEIRVPILPLEVVFTVSDGSSFSATIFLPPNSPHHDGPETLDEFLNAANPFIPVRCDGAFLLLGSDSILVAKATPEAPLLSRLPGRVTANVYLVRLHLENGGCVEGALSSNFPPESSRVSDAFNQSGKFVPIESSEAVYLVRKDRVTRVEI
ncbi:MAG: hypothetical protein ACRD16_04275, partial [Thermoanaerobaculia bacterium]